MPQKFLALWIVTTDDVTGGANTPEEICTDSRRGGSRGDIGQIHIETDFINRGRLRACDSRERRKLQYESDIKTPKNQYLSLKKI